MTITTDTTDASGTTDTSEAWGTWDFNPKSDIPEEIPEGYDVELTLQEAEELAQKVIDYFEHFNDITDYYMSKKAEKLHKIPETLLGYGQCDLLYDGYSIEPKDMEIEILEVQTESQNVLWNSLAQITATFPVEQMPGRVLKILVREKNTKKYLGVLRIGSPVLNTKPRNDTLGLFLEAKYINPVVFNGTIIVPAQPFGFNALGGKLMALILCSNEIRDLYNKKYGTRIALFETTSLYGSIKGVSQYDGLKPYIRYGGDTESKFPIILGDDVHHEILEVLRKKNSNYIADILTGSIKMKIYMRMVRTIKVKLKELNSSLYDDYVKSLEHSQSLNVKKRYYYCDYGIKNVTDVIMDENVTPEYKDNMFPEKFNLETIIQYWKKKAQKRYEKMKEQGKLRKDLEYWTPQRVQDKYIDIIR